MAEGYHYCFGCVSSRLLFHLFSLCLRTQLPFTLSITSCYSESRGRSYLEKRRGPRFLFAPFEYLSPSKGTVTETKDREDPLFRSSRERKGSAKWNECSRERLSLNHTNGVIALSKTGSRSLSPPSSIT